jgi:CRP/FNR family transcriptional regulator, cyclic AMP receptor protein
MAFNSDGSSPVTERAFETRQALDLGTFAARFGGVTRLTFKSGARLFAQGEPANCLFFIQEGQVQLTVVSSHGKEAILSVLGAGDFCGESCLSDGKARSASAVCIADTVVARLERANIARAIREDALFAEFFIVCVLKRAFQLRDNYRKPQAEDFRNCRQSRLCRLARRQSVLHLIIGTLSNRCFV